MFKDYYAILDIALDSDSLTIIWKIECKRLRKKA